MGNCYIFWLRKETISKLSRNYTQFLLQVTRKGKKIILNIFLIFYCWQYRNLFSSMVCLWIKTHRKISPLSEIRKFKLKVIRCTVRWNLKKALTNRSSLILCILRIYVIYGCTTNSCGDLWNRVLKGWNYFTSAPEIV